MISAKLMSVKVMYHCILINLEVVLEICYVMDNGMMCYLVYSIAVCMAALRSECHRTFPDPVVTLVSFTS